MQMTRARCAKCNWTYDVAAAPMPIDDWVRASNAAHCPMCANRARNTVAPPRDLTAEERAHKARLAAAPPSSANE